MPQKKETFIVDVQNTNSLNLLIYGAFQKLNWETKQAGPNNLTADTPGRWRKKGEEINIEIENNQLTVISKLTHGESFDLTGKNKRHIKEFIAAFEDVKSNSTEQQQNQWQIELQAIEASTVKAAEEAVKQFAEIDKVMNLSTGSRYITYGIIVINVLVFIAMVASGVDFFQPSSIDIIKWGANFGPLTLSGDWWRLITCVFVHIGIVHILFNMYALFSVGMYLEPMLGKMRYGIAYLSTGIFASLASLWWHTEAVPSAGASGAIFGMYGVFVALLTTNIIPKQIRKNLLQGIGIFVVYNLAYGLKSGIDNAAHIGGLLSGLVIGYGYYFTLKTEAGSNLKRMATTIVVLLTVGAAYFYLDIKKASAAERQSVSKRIEESKYKNGSKFEEKYNDIIHLQEKAMTPLRDTTLTDDQKATALMETSLGEWEKAGKIAEELKLLSDVSPAQKNKAEVVGEYINGRVNEIMLINRIVKQKDTKYTIDLGSQREKLDSLVSILNSQ